jgi:hypothetical protein
LQNESAGNTAKTLEQQNEATRLTQLGEGNERMRQVEANVPPWRKALREYGPPLGYVVGGAVGLGTRAGVYKRATNAAEARAAKAEGLFDDALEGTSKAAQNDRVSRVNSFWRQGGGNEPFNITPNQAPGFASNPNVSPVSSLYGPQRGQAALTNLGANALAGAEMTYAHVQGKDAQAELAASRDAINQSGPTENNIQRLQTAQDNAAWYDFLENAGRGSAIIYNGKAMIKPARNVKPDATAAERERLDLEDILRRPAPAPRTRAQKPAATESPARQAERESRKFNDQGESLGDILTKAAQSMRRDERFLPPDL